MAKRAPHTSITSLTRRQLLLATAATSAIGLRGNLAAAQTGGALRPPYTLLENGRVLARFSELVQLQLEMKVPPAEALEAAGTDGPVPGERVPPFVLFRSSPYVSNLQTWMQELQRDGAVSAQKTLQLVVRNVDGVVVNRFRLRNAIPARLTVNGLEVDPAGTFVQHALILCTRIEVLPL